MSAETVVGESLRLVVAVLTYRRPGLLRDNLPSVCDHVAEIERVARADGRMVDAFVLVVDNDASGSARGAALASAHRGVRYVVEKTPGIAAARNRAMREAEGSDLLVFIDDDEAPLPGWLSSLLSVWESTGAAGVVGRVVPAYQSRPDPWIEAGEFFIRRVMPTGTSRDAAAAGNLLLDMGQVSDSGISFDDPFGLTGGEDTLMTRRMTKAGLRLVWCNESVAEDLVPSERLTRKWVLQRAFSHGNTQVLIDLHLAEHVLERLRVRAWGLSTGIGRSAVGVTRFGYGVAARSLRHQARGHRLIWRGAGMVVGAFGISYEEYARPSERAPRPHGVVGAVGQDSTRSASMDGRDQPVYLRRSE